METVDKDIRIYKAPISLLNFKHTHNQRQQLTTPILFCGFVSRFKWLAIEFLETKLVYLFHSLLLYMFTLTLILRYVAFFRFSTVLVLYRYPFPCGVITARVDGSL